MMHLTKFTNDWITLESRLQSAQHASNKSSMHGPPSGTGFWQLIVLATQEGQRPHPRGHPDDVACSEKPQYQDIDPSFPCLHAAYCQLFSIPKHLL